MSATEKDMRSLVVWFNYNHNMQTISIIETLKVLLRPILLQYAWGTCALCLGPGCVRASRSQVFL